MNSTISLQIVQSVTMQLLVLGLWNQKLLPLRTFTSHQELSVRTPTGYWKSTFESGNSIHWSVCRPPQTSVNRFKRSTADKQIRRSTPFEGGMGEAFQNQDEEHWKKQRTGTSLLVIVFIVVEHKATKNKNFLSSTIRTQTSDVAARTDPDHNHVSLRAIYHQSGSVFSL